MKRWMGMGFVLAAVCSLATADAWAAGRGNQRGTVQRTQDQLRLQDCLSSSEGDQVTTSATTRSAAAVAVQRRIQDQDRINYPGNGTLTRAQKRANYLAQKAAARQAYLARKAAAKAAYQARRQTRTQDPTVCTNDCTGDQLRDQDRDRLRDCR